MSKAALRIAALFACTAGAVLASHTAYAVGPSTPPTPHPTASGSSTSTPPTGGPHHFLTAQNVPDYEWKFDNNFKDSGRFHPRGDLAAYDSDTPIHFGLGRDGSANGATTDVGRFSNAMGELRKEAFTFTFDIWPNGCLDHGTMFADGLSVPSSIPSHPNNTSENTMTMGGCVSLPDAKGVPSPMTGVNLKASFMNKKPDKTFGSAEVVGTLKVKAWNAVHIVYDGPNKLLTMYVNGTKTEVPTLGLITVPGEGRTVTGSHPNGVLVGAPKDLTSGNPYGNVDNFRFYSDALYPVSTATVGAHTGAGGNTSVR